VHDHPGTNWHRDANVHRAAKAGSYPSRGVVDHHAFCGTVVHLLELLDEPRLPGIEDSEEQEGHEKVEGQETFRRDPPRRPQELHRHEAWDCGHEHSVNFVYVDRIVVEVRLRTVVACAYPVPRVKPLGSPPNCTEPHNEGEQRTGQHSPDVPVEVQEDEQRDGCADCASPRTRLHLLLTTQDPDQELT